MIRLEELSKKQLREKKREANRLKKEVKEAKRKEQAKTLKKQLRQDMRKGVIPTIPIHEAMAAATRKEREARKQTMQDNAKRKILNNPNGKTIHIIAIKYTADKHDFAVQVGVRAYFTQKKFVDLRTAEFEWKVIFPHEIGHIQEGLHERTVHAYNFMLKKHKSNLKPIIRKKEK